MIVYDFFVDIGSIRLTLQCYEMVLFTNQINVFYIFMKNRNIIRLNYEKTI